MRRTPFYVRGSRLSTEKRFLSIDDLTHLPKPAWCIDGMFELNSLVMVAGPPASYKSFLVLDWVLSMAIKRQWNGRATTSAKVLYVLGEGKSNLLKRIQAWAHYHNVTPEERQLLVDNFRVSFIVPQFAIKASVDNMLAELSAEDFQPTVIVVDTFSRSFVGLDENAQKDTGMWIENADRLRQMGFTVIFIHHTSKNTEFGLKYRGSTVIMGAMDTSYTLQRDPQGGPTRCMLSCTKQKDHDEGDPLYFQRLIVRADSKEEGSVVLVPAIKIDDEFTQEGHDRLKKERETLAELMEDGSYENDKARVAEFIKRHPNVSPSAAQSRVSRANYASSSTKHL